MESLTFLFCRIKAAKGKRTGGAPARPTASFGQSTTTQQPGLFTNGAQSFPPTNSTPPIGNGSPNVSFGGFGGGGGDPGFGFSSSTPVNNPFSSISSSNAASGASNGSFGFSFGGSQPPAAAAAPPTGIFSFGGNQQPAASAFPSSTSQAPSSGLFGSSNAPGGSVFGTSAASTTPGAGVFGSTNGSSGFGAANGSSLFGSTNSTSQKPSGVPVFGQQAAEAKSEAKPEAPFKSFFGTPAQAVKTPFGQPVDDAMSTSPDNSPSRGGDKTVSNHWNKSLETVTNGAASSSSSNGGESPDHPHIEEEPRDNPFAKISRAKSSEPPKPVEAPPKLIFNTEKRKEEEKEYTEVISETPKANPFASISRQAQSAPKPAESQPKQVFSQSPTPATSNIFGKSSTVPASPFTSSTNSSTPANNSIFSPIVKHTPIVEQSPIVDKENSSCKPTNYPNFNMTTTQSTSIFNSQTSSQPTSSQSTNVFGMSSKPTQAATASPRQSKPMDGATVTHLRDVGTVLPQDRLSTDALAKLVTPAFRASVLAEDALDLPSSESGMDEEEVKYWIRERKLHRLNGIYKNFFQTKGNESSYGWMDLRPLMASYITMFEAIMVPIEGPLSTLIGVHGKEQGYRLFYQQNGSIPDDSGKRKSSADLSREDDNSKNSKIDAPPSQNTTQTPAPSPQSSATANKFMNFLDKADKPAASGSSKSKTPVSDTTPKPVAEGSKFKMPTFDPTANLMASFGKKAADTAAEAKKKAFDNDYDSDEETEAEWDRKYEEKMAAKAAELKKVQQNSGFGFKVNTFAPTSSLAPPSTNGGFNFSRSVSPAASANGSVFDAARSSTPGGSNIFGHLSNAGSDVEGSARGDADDEDSDDDAQQSNGAKTSDNQPNGQFGGFSESDDAPSDTAASGRSLFDRVEKRPEAPSSSTSSNLFGFPISADKSNAKPSSGLFGRVSRDEPSERPPLATTAANDGGLFGFGKAVTAGDQTWKADSPIKFNNGTTEPPKFSFTASTPSKATPSGFSFSPNAPTTTPSSSLWGPTSGSSLFGATKPSQSLFVPSGSSSVLPSGTTSRATTPGVSDVSGAETTGGEQEDTRSDPQIGDLVGMEAAKLGHDVLFESDKVKSSRYEIDPSGKKSPAWATQGIGPIAILKDQTSGVTKILMKKEPSGGIVINTRLMASTKYEPIGKRARFGIFNAATSKMDQTIIQLGSEEEATNFVQVCEEHKNQ